MRRTALALIGTLGITAAAGCPKPEGTSQPEGSPACNRPGVPVTVYIEVDGGKATTANKTVYLCKNKDWVVWAASAGDIQDPKFTQESPFPNPPVHDGKKVKSDKPKKKGSFPYTIQVTADGKTLDVDPSVEVME